MRIALEKQPDLGFTLTPARSRRVKAKKLSDTEFADDIALVTNTVKEAQELMREVEAISASVGLTMNEQKTKYPGREHPRARRNHGYGWTTNRVSE